MSNPIPISTLFPNNATQSAVTVQYHSDVLIPSPSTNNNMSFGISCKINLMNPNPPSYTQIIDFDNPIYIGIPVVLKWSSTSNYSTTNNSVCFTFTGIISSTSTGVLTATEWLIELQTGYYNDGIQAQPEIGSNNNGGGSMVVLVQPIIP